MLFSLALADDPAGRSLFDEIYSLYGDEVYHTAFRVLGSETEAEDVVHDAFFALLQVLHRFRDARDSRTRAFLLTVARNRAIDLRRRRRLEPLMLEDPDVFPAPEEGGAVRAVQALTPEDRDLLLLRFHTGLTVKEIAHMQNKKPAAVAKAITRAKARLAEKLREEGIDIDR